MKEGITGYFWIDLTILFIAFMLIASIMYSVFKYALEIRNNQKKSKEKA